MKANIQEMLMLGVQFIDGDTYIDGTRMRRGQYYGEVKEITVENSGVYANGKIVSIRNYKEDLLAYRRENIRIMWDKALCIGTYMGQEKHARNEDAIYALFECPDTQNTICEGQFGDPLSIYHSEIAKDALVGALGWDGRTDMWQFIVHCVTCTGQYYVANQFKDPKHITSEDHFIPMIRAILPGLKTVDIRAEFRDLKINLSGANQAVNAWEFLDVETDDVASN
jgi:hypothetical protein